MISKERLATMRLSIRRNSFAVCCGLALILLLFALLLTFDFGCNVIVDGEIIGTAKSKDCVFNLIDNINENFSPYFKGSKAISVKPTLTPKLVLKGHFTDEEDLSEALKATCPYLKKAYSVKSNGITVAAFSSNAVRRKTFDDFIAQYADADDKSSYTLYDNVEFLYESVPYGMIKNADNALKMLNGTQSFSGEVKISSDTELKNILLKYNITEEDFYSLNPDYKAGKTKNVKINSEIPFIRVVTNTQVTEKQIVEYKTVSVDDDSMYEGETKVDKTGSDGVKSVSKNICRINGKVLCENILDENVTDAVDEVLLVGTKKASKGKATGTFETPYDGNLSSRFGQRGARQHKGIDLCGSVGDDITAADGGVVVYSDWESGYGYVVKIDHQNGYTTFYAHCSELFAKVGDKVAKGDLIAAVGNTGNSTGPHLHFEIRKTEGNTALDPLQFIEQ